MIDNGANNWNIGLTNACAAGNMVCIRLMIEKGANDWNEGLSCACCNGYMDIAKLIIEKGATHCECNKFIKKHL